MRISDWSSDVCSSDLYAARLTAYMRFHDVDAHIAVLSCDEKGKTIAAVQDIVRRTQEAGLRRDDLLVSMGGGVCSDLVGFAASMVRRGIRHIRIPTTLIGQVDAGVGLKVGVKDRESTRLNSSHYCASRMP